MWRVYRYVSRGPIALQRLSLDGDGLVVYQLKHPFSNGTTHVLFEPLDFLARLAALVPRPRVPLVRYHGLFAPHAKHRHHIVTRSTPALPPGNGLDATGKTGEPKPTAPMSWMQRLRRVFDIDLRHCTRCGGTVRVIAEITDQGSPLLRIHAPAALVRPCTSSPGPSRIATHAMISPARRRAAPAHRPWPRCIRADLQPQIVECANSAAPPLWLASRQAR